MAGRRRGKNREEEEEDDEEEVERPYANQDTAEHSHGILLFTASGTFCSLVVLASRALVTMTTIRMGGVGAVETTT